MHAMCNIYIPYPFLLNVLAAALRGYSRASLWLFPSLLVVILEHRILVVILKHLEPLRG